MIKCLAEIAKGRRSYFGPQFQRIVWLSGEVEYHGYKSLCRRRLPPQDREEAKRKEESEGQGQHPETWSQESTSSGYVPMSKVSRLFQNGITT